tara:strand:- start:126 stop:614 length:489 start_codon:yes stop_codon:yes gene_type:complete
MEKKGKKEITVKDIVDIDYLNYYLNHSASILDKVCLELTKNWQALNIENQFFIETKAINFEKKYRIKVVIQSLYQGKNVIFYSRQGIISEQLGQYPEEMKEAVREFISKVMLDLMTEGIESLRRTVIDNNRHRLKPKDKDLEDYLLQYPLKADDVYPADIVK